MLGLLAPVSSSQLYDRGLLEMAHDHEGVTSRGLQPGQLLVLRTLDDQYRCAEVVSLRFTLARTIYRLFYGNAMDKQIAHVVVDGWATHAWCTSETVFDLLGECDALLAKVY